MVPGQEVVYDRLGDELLGEQHPGRFYRSHYFRGLSFPSGGMGIKRERELEVLAAWDSV